MSPECIAAALERDTAAMRSAEVAALMRWHSMMFELACDFVGLDPVDFVEPSIVPSYLPMPDQIALDAAAIRSSRPIAEE